MITSFSSTLHAFPRFHADISGCGEYPPKNGDRHNWQKWSLFVLGFHNGRAESSCIPIAQITPQDVFSLTEIRDTARIASPCQPMFADSLMVAELWRRSTKDGSITLDRFVGQSQQLQATTYFYKTISDLSFLQPNIILA